MTMPVHASVRRECLGGCRKCHNRDERSLHSDDGLCRHNTSVLDGLPLRCVGEWANEKIHYLTRYFAMFAGGMKNLWRGSLRYIEVCSGPGRCSTRDGYEQDGTALAVLLNPSAVHIADAVFIDYSAPVVDALNARIRALRLDRMARACVADYNDPLSVRRVLKARPFQGLSLCLIDPTSCDVPFGTVRTIVDETGGKCDFLISFFAYSDFRRNAVKAALDPTFSAARSKYSSFLGQPNFFERSPVVSAARANDTDSLVSLFREAYQTSLGALGYGCAPPVRIGDCYSLVFASQAERAFDFWRKTVKKAPDGQLLLFDEGTL